MAGKVAADHHFNPERHASFTNTCSGGRHTYQPIGANIPSCPQHICRYLVKNLTFKGYGPGQYNIKSRNPVACYHHQPIVTNAINVPYFASVKSGLPGKNTFHKCLILIGKIRSDGSIFLIMGKKWIKKPI
jgi:hypothetical protein